jgi:hypothetical protein
MKLENYFDKEWTNRWAFDLYWNKINESVFIVGTTNKHVIDNTIEFFPLINKHGHVAAYNCYCNDAQNIPCNIGVVTLEEIREFIEPNFERLLAEEDEV